MTSRKRLVFSYCCLALLLAVLFAVSLFWGSVALTPQAVLAALTGRGQDALSVGIITQLRLPRAVMAALLGAALSAAGYLLQTFFANPIAGPFVMGISSGAKLAVALVMVLFLNYGLLTSSAVLILAAFAGAMAAMAFVLAAARRVQRMSILVICGVMIGYICSAITEFVVAFAQDSSIVNLHNWSQGSFSGMTWGNVRTAALVVLPALAAAFCLAKPMAAYQMGEAYARSVGVDVRRFSRLLVLLSSLLAACVTAFAGPISFVGIAVPHLVKQLLGSAMPLVWLWARTTDVALTASAVSTMRRTEISAALTLPRESILQSSTLHLASRLSRYTCSSRAPKKYGIRYAPQRSVEFRIFSWRVWSIKYLLPSAGIACSRTAACSEIPGTCCSCSGDALKTAEREPNCSSSAWASGFVSRRAIA